jgi:hypothetical protein
VPREMAQGDCPFWVILSSEFHLDALEVLVQ